TTSLPIRQPCPPGACDCGREPLLDSPGADVRILFLNRTEEKRLVERLENLQSLSDLERLQQRMYEQLGIRVEIAPGLNEVRTMRGIAISIGELPGLCRKTRQAIPAAIRRGLEKRPEIAYELLNANDLLRDA
ncbi:MAG: ribosomal protein, partial [Pseudomonas sp.]|nr:ribosomal protein [Pseudomonas sp.]